MRYCAGERCPPTHVETIPISDSAPELVTIEVAYAVWRRAAAGGIDREQAVEIPQAVQQVLSDIAPVRDLIDDAMEIAFAEQHSVYDCIYLALARQRGSALATADLQLQAILKTAAWRDHRSARYHS